MSSLTSNNADQKITAIKKAQKIHLKTILNPKRDGLINSTDFMYFVTDDLSPAGSVDINISGNILPAAKLSITDCDLLFIA